MDAPGQPMSLPTFLERLRHDIAAFETNWIEENGSNPDGWPMTMPSIADWHEQFLEYCSD